MSGRDIRAELYALHRRKPGTRYYASDDTGMAIAFLLPHPMLKAERRDAAEIFERWRSGQLDIRVFSITVRPRAFLEDDMRHAKMNLKTGSRTVYGE